MDEAIINAPPTSERTLNISPQQTNTISNIGMVLLAAFTKAFLLLSVKMLTHGKQNPFVPYSPPKKGLTKNNRIE
ncbi:hypothetical protein AAV98_15325 [Bacillus sp. CHD6a]|nr:hypothetical protein AAV98_15325 [Bacillus sp. CHD6a]